MDAIINKLNDKQKEAVLFTDGALLVLAGAGSGKTRVITHRFAYLLKEKRLVPSNILAVTFTNKAAGEMKERIYSLTGMDTRNAWIRTFHSMGVMLLRRNPEVIGYPRDFVIYDDTDTKNLIKTIMKDLSINTETINPAGVADKISSLKDGLQSPDDYHKVRQSSFDDSASKVYYEYERLLRKNRAVDFPDLISLPIRLFKTSDSVLNFYQDLWHYVMVDEFQDTNSAQYELMNMICGKRGNICVVGDDDQSIYGWRGANVENIYDFKKRYSATVIPLEQNYRSTSVILEAANSVVSRINNRMPKNLWTDRRSDDKIQLVSTLTDRDESKYIVDTIDRLMGRYQCRDFAIFYRTNAQSRLFEEELLYHNIPYKIFGGQKFYSRKEIKDILAYIKLIVNPYDGASYARIINVPKRKIGDTTEAKVARYADLSNISYVEALLAAESLPDVNKTVLAAMIELGQILFELNQSMDKITPTNFVKILLDSIHYKDYVVNFDQDGLDRWSNVEELINSIKVFEENNPDASVVDFLNEITLDTSTEESEESPDQNYVSLMTIHNAKGLEFPVVFISGAVDGLLPHVSSSYSEKEMNEERRLFYVAITRAKDKLTISFPESRLKFGELLYCTPSPFLRDIPEELTEQVTPKALRDATPKKTAWQPKNNYSQYKPAAKSEKPVIRKREEPISKPPSGNSKPVDNITDLKEGNWIVHRQFGKGKVTFVSEKFIKVQFDQYGVQTVSGNFISSIGLIES